MVEQAEGVERVTDDLRDCPGHHKEENTVFALDFSNAVCHCPGKEYSWHHLEPSQDHRGGNNSHGTMQYLKEGTSLKEF